MENVTITDVIQYMDQLNSDLYDQDGTFGEYLARDGKVHDLKKEIIKLDEMRHDK